MVVPVLVPLPVLTPVLLLLLLLLPPPLPLLLSRKLFACAARNSGPKPRAGS
jgi:hypothetical protein